MSAGREWISGMYETKTGMVLRSDAHGIGYFRGFLIELGPRTMDPQSRKGRTGDK